MPLLAFMVDVYMTASFVSKTLKIPVLNLQILQEDRLLLLNCNTVYRQSKHWRQYCVKIPGHMRQYCVKYRVIGVNISVNIV